MSVTYVFRNLNELADWHEDEARKLNKRLEKVPRRSQTYNQLKAEQASHWTHADMLRCTALTGQSVVEPLDSAKLLTSVSGYKAGGKVS